MNMDMDVVLSIEHEGRNYGLLAHPTPLIQLVLVEKDNDGAYELTEADDELIFELQPEINEALKAWEVTLEQWGEYWLLSSELPDSAYDEGSLIELDAEKGELDAYILAELDTGSDRFWMLTPETVPMFAVEILKDDVRLLDDAEIAKLEPALSNALDAVMDEELVEEAEPAAG
jgi:hypothetical protein